MRFTTIATVAAALALGAATSSAQPVRFSGTTQGCFGVGCTNFGTLSTLSGLTFNGGSFLTDTDEDGFAAVGGTGNNFGSFTLAFPPSHNYNGATFRLLLQFMNPTTSDQVFGSVLTGNVRNTNNGVFVDFKPQIDANTFTYKGRSGTFLTTVNDVSVNANDPQQRISGNFGATVATVPEPSTYALMGAGLLGLVGAARRRRTA